LPPKRKKQKINRAIKQPNNPEEIIENSGLCMKDLGNPLNFYTELYTELLHRTIWCKSSV
jgi:hypothetical protein